MIIQPMQVLYYHGGEGDFPHGAGASEPGYYIYTLHPTEDGTVFQPEPEWLEAEGAKAGQKGGRFTHFIIDMPRA